MKPLLALVTALLCFCYVSQTSQAATTLRSSTSLLTPETNFTVVFDRAVVSDDQLNKKFSTSLIEIQPKLETEVIWTAGNIAKLTLKSAPEMAVQYTFSIVGDHKFINGQAIPKGSFGTQRAELLKVLGVSRRSKSLSYTRQPSHYVFFNDSVNSATAVSHFYYKNADGKRIAANVRRAMWNDVQREYLRKATWQQRTDAALTGKEVKLGKTPTTPIPTGLIVQPVQPLPVGKKWYLYLSATMPNESGKLKVVDGKSIWIGDVNPFELDNIAPYVEADEPRQINIRFNNYLPKSFTQEQLRKLVKITPAVSGIQYKVLGKTIVATGKLTPSNKYTVTVGADVTSNSGLVLDKAVSRKIQFRHVDSGLALPAFESGQYAHGNRLYAIDTVNIASVRIRVKRIDSQSVVRTMQGYRHYTGDGHNGTYLKPEHPIAYSMIVGKTLYDRTIFLDNAIDTSKGLPLDWNEVLKDRSGTLFISVEGAAKSGAPGGDRIAQSFIQLTDIGLAWKLSENEALIYAFSSNTGKPLPGVKLEVFKEEAELVSTITTGADGTARVPRKESARHLLASLGKDSYVVPFDNRLDTVSLWRFPVNVEWNHLAGWKRSALMFTDRNLYRPGETVQLKGIVRRFKDTQIDFAADKNAQLVISDSKGRVIFDEEITLSTNGTFDHTLQLPEETVGRFNFKLTLAEDPAHADESSWMTNRYRIFSHTINVQEFRRNAFEVESSIAKSKPGAPSVALDLSANYYQGQAVKNGKVQWYFTASQTGFYPKKYRDFLFGDHRAYDPWYWSHYFGYNEELPYRSGKDREGEAELNEHGKANLSFDLPKLDFPTALQVRLTSEVTDARDQTLTTRASRTVHPADTYIGISRVDRLVRVGEDIGRNLMAVDSQGKLSTQAVKVTAVIEREYHEAVKVKSSDGRVSIKNTKKSEQVYQTELTIAPNKVTKLAFTPKNSGRHTITLTGEDAQGRKFATATRMYVYGAKEYPWAVEDGMRIKLVPEKKRYLPGETARLLVMTPIEGTALVTVERAGVHRQYRRELKADNPVIEVPLTDLDTPNAFVSVMVIRGASASPLKHKEPVLKLGYCTLNVTNVKDRLAVSIDVEESQHRPGEPMTIKGTVKDYQGKPVVGAEVVLYAEDEGTLAVAGYDNPDPMNFFHAPRPLLVESGTSFSTFIAEDPDERVFSNKGFTIGGGGDDLFGGADDRKIRTDFDPCAVWKPSITTAADGSFVAKFINPDTLTRYRTIAVAMHGKDKFGSASSSYIVNKPLMLEPTPPRYASEGDALQPKVLVQNNSKFEATWKISLKTHGISEISSGTPAEKTITLAPGDQKAVSFDVQFVNTGTARWIWSATPMSVQGEQTVTASMRRDLGDRAENSFEVTYPVPLLRQMQFVAMRDHGQLDLLKGLDPELLGGRGHLDLDLSNSLLLEAGGSIDFLLLYPYGCVEQTTSSLMPWFAVRDLKSIVPGFQERGEKDIAKAIQKGANRLLSMQTRDGGLAYWPGGTSSEIWASAYGGMGLILARENGASVPQSAIDDITKWIVKSMKQPQPSGYYRNSWDMETRARALYVLALAKQAQPAMQNKMLDQKEHLSPTARAFLALAIHHSGGSKETATSLLTDISARVDQPGWMRYHSDEAMSVLAWSQIDPQGGEAEKSMQKMLAKRSPNGHWRTTWCNAWSLQAMASYARNVEKNRSPASFQLVTAGVSKTITLDGKNPNHHLRIPLEKGMKLIVNHDGKNSRIYARLNLSSKPAIAPMGARASSGLSITRKYQKVLADGSTEDLTNPEIGDLVMVSLNVTLPNEIRYLLIEDRLPAVFEAVNNDFASQRSRHANKARKSWRVSHTELRSDRAIFCLNRSWRSGQETVTYLARVTSAGEVTAPPAKVEAMYDPEKVALTSSKSLTVPGE